MIYIFSCFHLNHTHLSPTSLISFRIFMPIWYQWMFEWSMPKQCEMRKHNRRFHLSLHARYVWQTVRCDPLCPQPLLEWRVLRYGTTRGVCLQLYPGLPRLSLLCGQLFRCGVSKYSYMFGIWRQVIMGVSVSTVLRRYLIPVQNMFIFLFFYFFVW